MVSCYELCDWLIACMRDGCRFVGRSMTWFLLGFYIGEVIVDSLGELTGSKSVSVKTLASVWCTSELGFEFI